MKLIHYKSKDIEEYVPVYERHEEFEPLGLPYHTELHTMKIGDYLLTRNGYYLKLMNIIPHGKMDQYVFPRAVYKQWWKKDGTPSTTKLVFQPDHIYRTFKDGDYLLFVQLIFAGMKPNQAWYIVAKSNNRKAKQSINDYFSLLESDGLTLAIKEYIMASLQEDMNKVGIDNVWFAEQLKNMVLDKKTPVSIKQYALNKIESVLSTKAIPIEEAKANMQDVKAQILNRKQGA